MKPAAPEAARQQVEDTGFSAIFEKLIITVRAHSTHTKQYEQITAVSQRTLPTTNT